MGPNLPHATFMPEAVPISVIHFYVSLTHISLFVTVNITEICDRGFDGPNPRIQDRCSLVSTGYANSHNIWYLVYRKPVCRRDNPPRSGGNLMCLVWSSNSRAGFPKTLGESGFRN